MTNIKKDSGIYHLETHTIVQNLGRRNLTYGVPEKYRGRFQDGQEVKFTGFMHRTPGKGFYAKGIEPVE